MTLSLVRVDERLIHGQVVVGWGAELAPEHYVVVDESLAQSDWEQELYRAGLPEGVTVDFIGIEGARSRLDGWKREARKIVLLTRDMTAMAALAAEGGLDDRQVNLGGLHDARGRRELLPYLHLDPSGERVVRELEERGVRVVAQDLPSAKQHRVTGLLDES